MVLDVEAKVINNTRLSSDYNVIALDAPEIARDTAPGQFVWSSRAAAPIRCCAGRFGVRGAGAQRHRVGPFAPQQATIGVTTRLLFDAVEGDVVSCLGPLGRPIRWWTRLQKPGWWRAASASRLRRTGQRAGVARRAHHPLRRAKRPELFYLDWFETRGVAMQLSTEDGTRGDKGRVTLPLERALKAHGSADVMVYAAALNRARGRGPRVQPLRAHLRGVGRTRDGVRDGRLLQPSCR